MLFLTDIYSTADIHVHLSYFYITLLPQEAIDFYKLPVLCPTQTTQTVSVPREVVLIRMYNNCEFSEM